MWGFFCWRTLWFCRLCMQGLWANVLNPLFMHWAFWERCKGGSDRSFPGLTYSWAQREHSSVLGSTRYAYLNWWRAISGCHATASHILLSPTPSPFLTTSLPLPCSSPLSISSLFITFPLFSSFLWSSYAFLHQFSFSGSDSTYISLLLAGWCIGSGPPGLNSSLCYGNFVMLNGSTDVGQLPRGKHTG